MQAKHINTEQNPQFSLSFVHQNQAMLKQQQRLQIQIVRVHAIQKQRYVHDVWTMNQNQLCDFFTHYDLFPQDSFVLKDIVSDNRLKLIKSDGKIYFGVISKKKREGKGVSVGRDGRVYQGSFSNNEKNGNGIEIYPNGNFFAGQFMNGKKHGEGKFYWFSLNSHNPKDDQFVQFYKGQWWGGLPDGHGLHQKINGDLYLGSFKNGLKHGEGKQWYGNGDFYKGEFVNGLPEGSGEYNWVDGSTFKGDFKQGLRNGYGVWEANNDRLEAYKGHYSMDKKSGYGMYTWDNGWTYKGNFQNDYRNGYGELYDGRQNLSYRGFWQNGQQTEKEVIFSHRQKQINFKSLQFNRNDTRKSFGRETGQSDKKSRYSSKIYDHRPDQVEINTMGHFEEPLIKKRPQSHNSVKVRKLSAQGNRKSNKQYQSNRHASSNKMRPLVGTIKSNLFVPFRLPGRSLF